MSDLTNCPSWCVGHAVDVDFDGGRQVTHQRPVVASDVLTADVEWYEDLRSPDHPDYFHEPPSLIIGRDLIVPITAETLDQLSRAIEAARLVLATVHGSGSAA